MLSITVRDVRKPCAPYFLTGHWFFIDILHCDFTPLTWHGRTYRGYALRQRIHDQIRVPPGCYIIRGYATCYNVVLELAMVQVPCNSTVCVSLLPTTVRFCIDRAILGILHGTFVMSEETRISEKAPKEKINAAIRALEEIKGLLPKDELPYGLPVTPEELEKMAKREKEKPIPEELEEMEEREKKKSY